MPLTPSGKKVLAKYKKQYGAKKGKEYFYASIEDKKLGSSKWHKKTKKKHAKKHTKRNR